MDRPIKLLLLFFRMRNYKRKTTRGSTSEEVYELAAKEVLENKKSLREAARSFEICHVTLHTFMKKKKEGLSVELGYKKNRQVFNTQQEIKLAEYLVQCAVIYFGLLPSEVKKLAYEIAVYHKISNIPESWTRNKSAGNDWFTAFLKRNPNLALRSPEATSLSRATSFNRTNVEEFFTKYKEILQRYNLTASRIWNVDETGVTTVQKPKKIVAQRGSKQVGAVTSAERGVLVTVAAAANALGNHIPCMFVFPRIRYNDIFIKNGPPEAIGAGNSSGWMSEREFLIFLDHFIKHVKPTKDDPVLLFLDNHHSHVNVAVINKAKENYVILLSYPPHCSHKLQPLDVGVYGPLKNYVARLQTNWMINNPGKTMTIYDVPGIVREAFPLAFTPNNIVHSFRKAGIWPCNEFVFGDDDFAPSFVTDRPMPLSQSNDNTNAAPVEPIVTIPPIQQNEEDILGNPSPTLLQTEEQNELTPENLSLTLGLEASLIPEIERSMPNLDISVGAVIEEMSRSPVPGTSTADSSTFFSPEAVRPLPKAAPRSKSNRGRKRKCAILTDTPEKTALEEEAKLKNNKKKSTANVKVNKEKQRVKKRKVEKKKKRSPINSLRIE